MRSGWAPTAPQCLSATSIGRTLVEATSRALAGRDCWDLAETPGMRALSTVDPRPPTPAVLPFDHVDTVDAEAVARWVVDQYGDGEFPTAVLGSAHGSAAHLAVALRAPWLPLTFSVDMAWPEGNVDDLNAAVRHGRHVARRLLDRNDGVRVRQVHDPVRHGRLAARQTTHHLAWREVPGPYRQFLHDHVRADGHLLLVRDERRWPDLADAEHAGFQLGTPSTGLEFDEYLQALIDVSPPCAGTARMLGQDASMATVAEHGVTEEGERALRRWAGAEGRALVSLGYRSPDQFSAAVADLYRAWLRAAGKTANRVAVECGRLLDPYQILRAGLVPYWCEVSSASAARRRRAVARRQ